MVVALVSTLAGGNGLMSAGFMDGPGTSARFRSPGSAVMGNTGNVFVADSGNNLVRRITSLGKTRFFIKLIKKSSISELSSI